MTSPPISLIWAEAHDRVIGAAGGMPWHVPEDLAHFKELTAGGTVVMGRKTWDALDPRFRPLPGRRNIVVTRDPEWSAEGAEVAHSRRSLRAVVSSPIWVIGGAELFAATIDRADRLEVTELDLDVEGDTWAPPIGDSFTVAHRDRLAGVADRHPLPLPPLRPPPPERQPRPHSRVHLRPEFVSMTFVPRVRGYPLTRVHQMNVPVPRHRSPQTRVVPSYPQIALAPRFPPASSGIVSACNRSSTPSPHAAASPRPPSSHHVASIGSSSTSP